MKTGSEKGDNNKSDPGPPTFLSRIRKFFKIAKNAAFLANNSEGPSVTAMLGALGRILRKAIGLPANRFPFRLPSDQDSSCRELPAAC
jgi:hypothetical protein